MVLPFGSALFRHLLCLERQRFLPPIPFPTGFTVQFCFAKAPKFRPTTETVTADRRKKKGRGLDRLAVLSNRTLSQTCGSSAVMPLPFSSLRHATPRPWYRLPSTALVVLDPTVWELLVLFMHDILCGVSGTLDPLAHHAFYRDKWEGDAGFGSDANSRKRN